MYLHILILLIFLNIGPVLLDEFVEWLKLKQNYGSQRPSHSTFD